MEIHIPTQDTKLAAALSTLGFPLKLRDVLDDTSGKVDHTWQIGTVSVSRPGLKLNELLKHYRDGTLATNDPEHPLLDGLYVLRIRERILSVIKDGRSIALAECEGGKRTAYIHHPTIEAPMSFGRFTSRDFRFVCALGRLGIPIVSIKGIAGSNEFTTTARSVVAGMKYDAVSLHAALTNDNLAEDHPLRICIKTLENHSRCLNAIKASRHTVLLRKPNSKKAVWVHEDASDAAYDRAQKHFRI